MGGVRHRLSGSKIAIASRCLHWARPDVTLGVDQDTPGRRIGSALHECAEKHPSVDIEIIATKWNLRPSERDKVEELYAAWREWWPGYLGSATVECEVPFAWCTTTGKARRLPQYNHRNYSECSWHEIPMTIDALICRESLVEVLDLKTTYDIISAEEHAQLRTNALAVANHIKTDEVRVTIANVAADGVRVNSSTVGGFDFDAIAGRLARLVASVPTAQPRPGDHCASMWCPALGTCSATRVDTDALVRARPDLAALVARSITSHDEAYRIKTAIKPAMALLKELDAMTVAWAEENGGIRTPDGGYLKRVPVTKRTADASNKALRSKLLQMFGDDATEVVKTKETISMDAVRRLAKIKAPRGQKGAAEKAAIEELEATGGMRLSVFSKWSDEDSEDES